MWLPRLIPNFYVRPACYMKSRPMKKTASVTDTKSFSGYGALHRVCSACMWSRPHICNNITRHIDPYHSIRVLREVPFHYFQTTSLNWDFFNCTIWPLYPVETIEGTHWKGGRVGPMDVMDVLDTRQNIYSLQFRSKNILMPKTIVLSFHWMIHRVSTRNINGTSAVNLLWHLNLISNL